MACGACQVVVVRFRGAALFGLASSSLGAEVVSTSAEGTTLRGAALLASCATRMLVPWRIGDVAAHVAARASCHSCHEACASKGSITRIEGSACRPFSARIASNMAHL